MEVISHEIAIQMLLAKIWNIPVAEFPRLNIPNSSVTKMIMGENNQLSCESYGRIDYLPQEYRYISINAVSDSGSAGS